MSDHERWVKKVIDYYKNNKTCLSHSESIMAAFSLEMWCKKGLLTESVRQEFRKFLVKKADYSKQYSTLALEFL